MLYEKLPNIGDICTTGFSLRVDCATAISAVEIAAGGSDSGKTSASKLRDYFIACANAADKAAGGSGSGVVSGGVVLTADQVVVTDGDSVVVNDNGGTANAKSPGVASVAAGVLTAVTLAA